jgi:hypothetical protein
MTTPLPITEQEFETTVRALAAANPDFVYTDPDSEVGGCSYFPDEMNPQGCIIGAALREHGLISDDPSDSEDIDGTGAFVVLHSLLDFPEVSDSWFQLVQSNQDQGASWSEAVRLADMHSS